MTARRVRYKEAAQYTGIPEGTLRSMVCLKTVPHIRVGPRLVLLDLDALDAWLAARTVAVSK
ncbi:MAG: excisionase family DNA-binding protein [Proteobacteria bacterium]|nr:excisionase family DNA-binding protein [Pseudomonadota bacterium]